MARATQAWVRPMAIRERRRSSTSSRMALSIARRARSAGRSLLPIDAAWRPRLMGGLRAVRSPRSTGSSRIRRSSARRHQPDGSTTPGRPGPSPWCRTDGQLIPPLPCVAETRAGASSAVIQFAGVSPGWVVHGDVRRATTSHLRRATTVTSAGRRGVTSAGRRRGVAPGGHRDVRRATRRHLRRAKRDVRRATRRRAVPTLPGRTSPPSAGRPSPRCAARSTGPSALPRRPGCGRRARHRTRRHAAAP